MPNPQEYPFRGSKAVSMEAGQQPGAFHSDRPMGSKQEGTVQAQLVEQKRVAQAETRSFLAVRCWRDRRVENSSELGRTTEQKLAQLRESSSAPIENLIPAVRVTN